MGDKVKPLGMEIGDAEDGDFPIPRELDPSEDLVSVKGVAFEDSDDYQIEKVGTKIRFKTNGIQNLDMDPDGIMSVRGVTDYEDLITDDDHIPNKKYTDDADGGINAFSLFIADANGEIINQVNFTAVSTSPIAGPDQYPLVPEYTWGVAAQSAASGTVQVRLFNITTATVVATLTWTNENIASLKSTVVTIDNGIDLYELQILKTGGSGILFSSRMAADF